MAKEAGLLVAFRPAAASGQRRRRHEGTVYRRKDGLWVARIQHNGTRHQVTSADERECLRKLRALQRSFDAAGAPPPPPAEVAPNGREFVRLSSPTFRRWIYERDGGLCGICGLPVAFAEMHVDHIRPRIEGGSDHVSNFRISHPRCNLRRRADRDQRIWV